jgi:1-deoxy-D-xylulose-5-phosphate synthase
MVLMMPKDENEGQHMVYTALQYDDGPIAMRFPRGNGLGVPLDETLEEIPIGTWEVLKEGKDAVILTFGTTIPMAMKAANLLEKQGCSVKVINARFIKPLDSRLLTDLLLMDVPVLTIEEAALQGGFGSAVLEFASDEGFRHVEIARMGIPDHFIEHGSVKELWSEIGLTPEEIVQNIKSMVTKKQKRA